MHLNKASVRLVILVISIPLVVFGTIASVVGQAPPNLKVLESIPLNGTLTAGQGWFYQTSNNTVFQEAGGSGPTGPNDLTGPFAPTGPAVNLSSYTGAVSITRNSGNRSNQISGESINGVYDVMAYAAKGDCVTDDNGAILAAYNAACSAAGGPNSAFTPAVYFPHPSCDYLLKEPLLLNCAHQVQLVGDSELTTSINVANNDFPALVLVPSNYASQSVGTMSAASLVTGSGAALNFATGSSTPWYLNLSDAMVNGSSPGAYPLNGLSAFDVRLFFKSASLAGTNYLFTVAGDPVVTSKDCSGLGGKGSEASLCVSSAGALCYQLTTGGTSHRACGASSAATTGTVYEAEMAYNGSNIYVFLNGTQISGSPFAATGTVTETAYTTLMLADQSFTYPDTGDSSLNFQGQIDSFQLSNVARHTSNYTADTSKFSSDSNTLILINGKAFNNPLVEADYSYGATDGWLVARGKNGPQANSPYIRNLAIGGGSIGIFQVLEPSGKFENLTITSSTYIGLELWNNDYEGRYDNLRFTMPTTSEAAISASTAANVEHFIYPQITISGYHGIEGYELSAEYLNPFISTSTHTRDAIYSQGDSGSQSSSIYDLGIDNENGGAAISLFLLGSGTYNVFGSYLAPGIGAPCVQLQPTSGGNKLGPVNLYGTRCDTSGITAPSNLVNFLGSNAMNTPMAWYNPVVNGLSYSNQTTIPWTNTPANLMVYGDVIQPPVKTVATLPSCSAAATGWVVQVGDCNANCATYLGTTFTGGGSTRVTVQCNGTAWELH
jgi:hypothetical protein